MWEDWIALAVSIAIAVAAAALITVIVSLVFRLIARRAQWPSALVGRARPPFRTLVVVIAVWIAVLAVAPAGAPWLGAVTQAFVLVAIAAGAWLLSALVSFAGDLALARYRIDVPDNRVARRMRTQVLILRRLAIALIVILAIGSMLLTFDAVRAVGASVLASAGIASIVAGLAAQSVLANMFAGVQLVFSDAIRVDDVVVVEGEWGRIGEITLSYVVVDLWDDRRLVLPCTYFTTKPFQNWTRTGSELLGAVEFDLDWRVSPARMREELERVLAQTPLWDGRASVLQVTEATGGFVRVRVLVTAHDAPTLFDLRCIVRERLVDWVQRETPAALPVQRVLMGESASPPGSAEPAAPAADTDAVGLFTGSEEAEERARHFTQAIPVITPDREADER
ncbi:mechanosensitive ion channel family protein [Microbacterium sp. W1N]|uniref:mechanosensitive ion channel family protein n=1 Tax=Microbacterium festucae TaxID=2977531 RepID=UPI0021BF731A|nr:mechanosensitive ion channel family protein [Microbacterium festucae]MCT9820732.1 mechanosensitive ion channel family protein [Microbacterium festucae]